MAVMAPAFIGTGFGNGILCTWMASMGSLSALSLLAIASTTRGMLCNMEAHGTIATTLYSTPMDFSVRW